MPTVTVQQAFEFALQHHQAGRLAEAEALYRQILVVHPNHADALHLLGVVAHQLGRHDLALNLIRRAIVLDGSNPTAHSNLGEVYRTNGRVEEAIAEYCEALRLKPNYAEAHVNLGNALRQQGRVAEAIAAYRRALEIQPDDPETLGNLGALLAGSDKLDEAITTYHRALRLKPDYPLVHSNLGDALRRNGQLQEAISACRRALQLNPNFPEACNNLGAALAKLGKFDQAVAAYRRAIELQPDYAEAHNNLGNIFSDLGQVDQALAAYQRATELKPNFAEAYNNMGTTLKDRGELAAAIFAFQRALQLNPKRASTRSNLLYTLHFLSDASDSKIAEGQNLWNQQFREPLRALILSHANDRDPERKLRIGYVSPDFRQHAEAHFVVPLLESHDHERFEIHCYASVARPDDVTERLRLSTDVWHNVCGLSDHDLSVKIREDEIDILVDLTMHMADNRLLVFARKPAPIQVSWLAYPGSTGLETIDYRVTDSYLDPLGFATPYYSEQSVRLPDCWCCYNPLTCEPLVNALPASAAGFITFGCLNNFCKVSDATLAQFGSVLQAVKNSQLILLIPEGAARQRILEQMHRYGIARNRIDFVGRVSRPDYLRLYHRIDIALDTLPYNGITTTCDALWMGVPVLSLRGKTAPGRAGHGLLVMVGLSELATEHPEDFVRIAESLAADLPRLSRLRSQLRSTIESSPLMDGPRFARNMEACYRSMWRRWCESQQA